MRRLLQILAALAVTAALVLVMVHSAAAEALIAAAPGKTPDLNTVIGRITTWLVGLLVSLATLFLTVGGIRYLLAGGDPSEVAKAKDTLKYAAIGYGIAVLAPVLVTILRGFVASSP